MKTIADEEWRGYWDKKLKQSVRVFIGREPELDDLLDGSNGIFFSGGSAYLLKSPICAELFLRAVVAGEIDLLAQQRLLDLLDQLRDKISVKGGAFSHLQAMFLQAMQSLADGAAIDPARFGHVCQFEQDEYDYRLGFVDGGGGLQYGLQLARINGLLAAYRQYGLIHSESMNPIALCGRAHINISEPKYAELASMYKGKWSAGVHAEITKMGRAPKPPRWKMVFLDFPGLRRAFYSVELAAYEAAAGIVAKAFQATVRADGDLQN